MLVHIDVFEEKKINDVECKPFGLLNKFTDHFGAIFRDSYFSSHAHYRHHLLQGQVFIIYIHTNTHTHFIEI